MTLVYPKSFSVCKSLPYICRFAPFNLHWFNGIKCWSEDDCVDLLAWYLVKERFYRRGWNNNMSLVNKDVTSGQDVNWSLLLWNPETFKKTYPIIIPFKFETDSRGASRAYTTFSLIKNESSIWCTERNDFLQGSDRSIVLEAIFSRICSGFGWPSFSKFQKYKIFRYRLAVIFTDPKLNLSSGDDVHHKDGIKKILSGNSVNSALNDRVTNLEVQPRKVHYQIHLSGSDSGWVNMP